MIDISTAIVKNLVIHEVGNSFRDEGIKLSNKTVARTPSLDGLLLKNYLAPTIRHGDAYAMYHESELALNTIFHYTELVFANQTSFLKHSAAIAKHLYSSSTHPNIGGGEFMLILFDDIKVKGAVHQALGLFRVETKSDYLDVIENKGSFQVNEKIGISVDKIQKGAIVFSGGLDVFVVDALSQKTKYWLDTFLKVEPVQTSKTYAKAAGAFIKAVSNKVTIPNEALEFSKQLQTKIETSDNLSIGDIKSISNPYVSEEEVNGILSGIRSTSGISFENDSKVDCKQLTKYAKEVVKKARIADGINIVISNNEAYVSSLDIKKTKSGIRATIDIQMTGE